MVTGLRLPLRFEPNVGQTDPRVRFLARGSGADLFLTDRAATFVVPGGPVTVRFAGARPSSPVAAGNSAGTTNYFLGSDPSRWRTGVPASTAVRYPRLWPGIGATVRGLSGGTEYRFRIGAGADPRSIALAFGDAAVTMAPDGALLAGALRQSAPVAFQRIGGARVPVDVRFTLRGDRVGFALGDYDRDRPLVVDPAVRFSTFFGGSGSDIAWATSLGSNSTFMAGETSSPDFPVSAPSYDATLGGSCDAFLVQINVHKLDPVVDATYLGGSGCDRALGLATTSGGAAYLAGVTNSTDFPTTAGAYSRTAPGGAHDAWVAAFSPSGKALTYGTYLGGSGDDSADDLALNAGIAYVAGTTDSTNFPSTTGPGPAGGTDAFATAVNASGSGLVYSRLLGAGAADAGSGIAVGSDGSVTVVGTTASSAFPTTAGAFQTAKAAGTDAFAVQLTPAGAVSWSSFLGGGGDDRASSVAVRAGVAYVAGSTSSGNFPTTAGAYKAGSLGGGDGFITAFEPGGASLTWSSYLGGSGPDAAEGVAADNRNNVYVVGTTASTDMAVSKGPFQDGLAGGTDAFAVMLKPAGASATIATYLGGSQDDAGHDVSIESAGEPVIVGQTASATFITSQRPPQGLTGGGVDAFDASLSIAGPTRTTLADAGFGSASVTAVPDTNVQWDLPASDTIDHSIVDGDGTGLFGSNALRPPGSSYANRFLSAGTYAVVDGATGHTSEVAIKDTVKPGSGTTSTQFNVIWCAGQVPAWFVFDVQVQLPGSAAWTPMFTGTTAANRKYAPASGPGTYSFRSRVRNTLNGNATGWSPPRSISVT
jgi:hypothetical protein